MGNRLNRINIDLGQYKQAWVEHCRARAESPSAVLRQLIAGVLAEVPAAVTPQTAGKIRKQLLLTAEESVYVNTAAQRAGMRDGRWVVALIRARMGRQVQLGQAELALLGKSNLALLAIGRNLNQLARAAHSGPAPVTELVPVLGALRVQLSSHVDSVARLLAVNQEYWRTS